MSHMASEAVDEVDESVFWKINYDQFNIRFRNTQIIRAVGERVNKGAEAVMKAAFTIAQDKIRTCHEEQSVPLSATLVAHHLPSDAKLRSEIVVSADGTRLKPSQQQIITEFLDLLCTDRAKFLSKVDERGAGQYKVNLSNGTTALKRRLVESVVKERYGSISHRLFRILVENQKLDEKQITKIALVAGKEVREKLHQLAMAGLVELQEVPKSVDRVPSRTFYLWYVPLHKCEELIMNDCYQALANIRQRHSIEVKSRSKLLRKVQREDVIANPGLLTALDHAQLQLLNKVLEWLEVAELRLDAMIMILRDF
ncbi:hypothetical protein K493DRAFT_262953 [Basidiobolus meristosporus CBS 931.73]|uniref:DNA-directed RNA polymerase III subunit RPC3 n=1 Tax=Basidiobolus meristosporus CBS 931.73 TaxID=1314790 RepID=A0A1Y1Y4K1_9FUNG|nr:hypothetical protein K493DRAFT_262953 [Basidiobolus meristosporus CBS 931.73]|eukprot:ORX92951.1 hypothetical protein K493DRAFT_262953 [Basidiobolus meristosporus CBS 931.73]